MINTYRQIALLIIMLASVFVCVSCRENKVLGEKPDPGMTVISVSEAMQPENFDRKVRVRGTVKQVCQEEGCWMTITDGKSIVRMTFKDEAFRVALNSVGDVIVTGVVHEELVDEEAAASVGETLGLTREELAQISGDQRWPLMTASGVEFLQPQP